MRRRCDRTESNRSKPRIGRRQAGAKTLTFCRVFKSSPLIADQKISGKRERAARDPCTVRDVGDSRAFTLCHPRRAQGARGEGAGGGVGDVNAALNETDESLTFSPQSLPASKRRLSRREANEMTLLDVGI